MIEQIIAQLDRLVPVHKVDRPDRARARTSSASWRWSRSPAPAITGSRRCASPTSIARGWSTRRPRSFVFEVTGGTDKIDKFVELMREVGLVEVARTGVVAIARGREAA